MFARIGAIMTDPRVQFLAEWAVSVANFVNQTPIRVALVIVGVAILVWRWRPVWDLRHRLRFTWRAFLGEETWIGLDDALRIIRSSDWAKLREPTPGLFGNLGIGQGLTEYQRDNIRFGRFIAMTLESFEQGHSNAVRLQGDTKEYAESKLRSFVDHALDAEVIEKFGKIPT